MSTLGRNGRFGNQIFQYAFLSLYGRRHNLEIQTPPWVGQSLFGFSDPPVESRLPIFYDECEDRTVLDKLPQPIVNVDVFGYCQYHTSYYAKDRRAFIDLFRPLPQWAGRLNEAVARLRPSRSGTLVGVHLRRQDFGYGRFFIAPSAWYVEWLDQHWRSWHEPILYVASDEIDTVVGDFARFRPVTASDLGVEIPPAPFYTDYYVLTQSDVVATSNSSFSFSASMLNERATTFVRPILARQALVTFDPWNTYPVVAENRAGEPIDSYAIYREICHSLESALTRHRSKQTESSLEELYRLRLMIAEHWLGMGEHSLPLTYTGALGHAHRLIWSTEAHRIPLRDRDRHYRGEAVAGLQDGLRGAWALQFLLTAMLFCRASELPMVHDLSCIPQWLMHDYLEYLRLP